MEVATAPGRSEPEHHVETEQQVSPLELFFDLVFVFAFTQVTELMSHNPSWEGVGQGMLILAAIWWAWGAYAWLTNEIDPEETVARLAIFASMAAMLIAGLAIPDAFGDHGVRFGVAYFLVRLLHIVVFASASDDISVVDAVRRLAVTAIPGPALLIAAGFADGGLQAALWCAALAIDYAGPYVLGVAGYRVSPAHFAERFGLIIIIALGESIVAIGVGASGIRLDATEIVAIAAGVAIACALWWAYFDVVAIVAERKFREARGLARNKIARDSYSYLHLPMIAGIVLLALGVKKTLGHVDEPLKTVPAIALCGGVALYLLGHIAFRWRNVHSLNRPRLVAAAACLAVIPLATEAEALIAEVTIAAILVALICYEAIAYREARARVRANDGR